MRRRRNQSGFALLLVFLMAAIIAIMLYMEIPRVAFDAQRQKEDLLMYRGEQYKRALQVYFTTNKRFPAKIEDLEDTNGKHFLRRRYKDPMTGKDEWRLIHTNGMTLTDSKIQTQQGQKKDDDKDTTAGQYVGIVAGLGQTLPGQSGQSSTPGGNLANRRRDSDNRGPGGVGGGNPTDPNAPPGVTQPTLGGIPGQPIQTGMPGQPGVGMPGLPGMPPGVVPGQPPSVPGGNTGTGSSSSGGSYLGGGGSYLGGGGTYLGGSAAPTTPTGQPSPGSFPPGTPVNSQTGGVSAAPGTYSTQSGPVGVPPGFQQPGMNPAANSAAQNMIQNLLTQPRPGGIPTANSNGMQTMGGGIAGFASTVDQDSIMVYNDQTNYSLWEFVFDINKMKKVPNPNGNSVGTPASQLSSNPFSQQNGQNPGQNPASPQTQQTMPGPGYGRQ
jgi:type II secretory pathway pseudopilin PulG